MYIVTEKRKIVGMLKTLTGTYALLDQELHVAYERYTVANIVDEEGFENYATFSGDFIVIPQIVPSYREIKRIATEEEQEQIALEQLQSANFE